MDLSVIVPIYNAQDFLVNSLGSLESQNLGADVVEFILIDDGSSDSSLKSMQEFADRDKRFVIVSRQNKGYGATLNEGIALAKGSYVGVLEPDDFIDGQMYKKMLMLAFDNDLDIVRSNYEKFWSKAGIEDEVIAITNDVDYDIVFNPQEQIQCFFFAPAIWTMLVKKSLIEDNAIRLMETSGAAFQDTSYSFKVWACAKKAMCVKEAYVNYRQDNENSSINNPNISEYVSIEYDEIYRYIADNFAGERQRRLFQIAMRRQFLAYVWNYERLSRELHASFAKVAHADLKCVYEAGFFEPSLYKGWERSDLLRLVESDVDFVKFKDSKNRVMRKLIHVKDSLFKN